MSQDIIGYAHERMDNLTHEQLKGLVLVACNQLGMSISGGNDYKNPKDAEKSLTEAITWIFDRYDNAMLGQEATVQGSSTPS